MTLIDDLQAKKETLTEALYATIDGVAYDKIDAELREVSKALVLAENQEKKRRADEETTARKKALAEFNAEKKRIEKAKQAADAMDADLFEQLHTTYEKYSSAYDSRMKIMQDTKQLQFRAEELGLEAPPNEIILVCNFSDNQGDKRDFYIALIAQYVNAVRQLHGAKKRGEKGIPEKPGMGWYVKGGGQFYPGQQQG